MFTGTVTKSAMWGKNQRFVSFVIADSGDPAATSSSNIKSLTRFSLLSSCCPVNDTIANNIAYGYPGASRKEIEEAARQANALDFILNFEEGFDTVSAVRRKGWSLFAKITTNVELIFFVTPFSYLLDGGRTWWPAVGRPKTTRRHRASFGEEASCFDIG